MAKKRNLEGRKGAESEVVVEKPSLDLDHSSSKGALPERVPDVFGEEEVEEVLEHEQDIELESMLKDVDVFLIIGDRDAAKEEYKKMIRVFNGLPLAKKKAYLNRVKRVYDEIVHFNRFHYRMRRFFLSKRHAK
ncbi:hypothetical protein JXA12_06015 [Candidatus Woesearchaeota archaeon]|nr:hypothetical protein [Candidatus Woesearchaeota archaeon]